LAEELEVFLLIQELLVPVAAGQGIHETLHLCCIFLDIGLL